jgi:ribonuclease BN (tRNA processing enzyme)
MKSKSTLHLKLKLTGVLTIAMLMLSISAHAKSSCGRTGVWLQVLGSGGPEINDKRASSGYLVWQDGRARVLVDMGPGSLLRYEQSGARIEDLEVVLLSHLHADHSADLPALIKASFFTERSNDLPIYGPSGNSLMPDTNSYVQSLFGETAGAYRYLSGYLTGDEAFRLLPHTVSVESRELQQVLKGHDLNISAIAVHHGPIPALAWRVDIGTHAVVFSGDMNGDYHTLPLLAAGAGLLVAHHAVPQNASGGARDLHMPPSVIGEIASEAKVKQLVLSHRMTRTLGREKESTIEIKKQYTGPLKFAEDGQCFKVD